MKPQVVVDLGASFKVIEERKGQVVWRTLEKGYATRANAIAVARKYHLTGVWMVDDLGYKEYISAKPK